MAPIFHHYVAAQPHSVKNMVVCVCGDGLGAHGYVCNICVFDGSLCMCGITVLNVSLIAEDSHSQNRNIDKY